MSALAPELDALAADDLSAMFGPQLLERLSGLLRERNRLDAQIARTVRQCELTQAPEHDGLKTMASWLRGHARLSPAAASHLVRNGRALEQLPAVGAAHAAGQVSAEQVTLTARVVTPANLALAADQGVDLAGVDRTLVEVAAECPYAELATVVHHYLERLDSDGLEPDPTEQRVLSLARHADGSVSGRFELDAIAGEKLQACLEAMVQAGRCAGETRSRGQQQADALVQLCDNALAAGDLPVLRKSRPQVFLTLSVEDLCDPATNPGAARTDFGATISAARARWVACDAEITRIVLGPDGQPLDDGRTLRLVPAALRRAVVERDRRCVFVGCGAPHHWCDVHHLLEWINGGATSLGNSALLCERHHTKVHHGFRVERDTGGRWHTYRPDGTEILASRQPAAA